MADTFIPNRPLVGYHADFTAGPPGALTGNRVALNSASRRTFVRQCDTQRGRQYELDQVQSGTCNLTITDPLEYLNPSNTGSPLNSGGNLLKPYRAMDVVAWWNPSTLNLSGNQLNSTNVVSGSSIPWDPSFESGTSGWTSDGTSASFTQSTTQAFVGTHSLSTTYTSTSDHMAVGIDIEEGYTYTASLYVFAPSGCTVSASFRNFPSRTVIASASSTVTGSWQRLVMTGVSSSTFALIQVSASAASAFPVTFYVDAVQLEFASTVSAFTTSGPKRYPIYAGYVERYPIHYDMSGKRGIRPLTAVDALSVLARTQISQSYTSTILADSPNLYIPYNDQALPQSVQLPMGGQPFTGYVNTGNSSGSVNFGGDTFLDGSSTVSVVQQNSNPAVSFDPAYITYVGTRQGSLSYSPQSATVECWAKVTSGTAYFGLGSTQAGEDPNGEATGLAKYLGWYTAAGSLFPIFNDPNGGSVSYGIGPSSPDGQWHYYTIRLTGGNNARVSLDSSLFASSPFGFSASSSISVDNIFVDATTYFGGSSTQIAVCNLAVYPVSLSDSAIRNHYNRGIGYSGESAGTRVARILSQYWAGSSSSSVGHLMMAPDYGYNSRFVLDVLQEIVESERGLLYAGRTGSVIFEDRSTRYLNQVSKWTLGENPTGASPAEYPYVDYQADFDPTYTFSQANLTRPGNSSFAPMVNSAAQADYGQRILSQQVQCNTDFDLQQAGTFYLKRYGTPVVRIQKLTLNPSANPAMWDMALSITISDRITVKRRSDALTTSADYYVEQVSHHISETGEWTVDLQCSPVFVPTAWILGDSTYGVLGTTTVPTY